MPGLIARGTGIAYRQRRVSLANPGPAVPDGDGGYRETLVPLDPPALFAYVRPIAMTDLERVIAGTVISQATHIVTLPYHPGITTTTVLHVEDYPRPARRFAVVAVVNVEDRNADLRLACSEVVK